MPFSTMLALIAMTFGPSFGSTAEGGGTGGATGGGGGGLTVAS